jgi:hypothetical protein
MIRNRHAFLLAAGLVLVPAALHGAEADRLLPADTAAVLTVNVRAVLDSGVVQKHALELIKGALKHNEQVEKLLAAAGVDPLKDLTSVVVAAPGLAPKKVVAIVHGAFDLDKIHKAADAYALKNPAELVVHKEGGLRVYESKQGTHTTFAAFVDRETLVASPTQALVTAAAGNKKDKAKVSAELQAALGAVNGKQGVWLAAVLPAELKKLLARNQQAADLADKVQSLAGGVTVDNGVQAAFQVVTTDAEAADKLAGLLDSGKGFAALLVSGNPQFGKFLTDVIEAIEINAEKTTVKIGLKVTAEQFEKGLKPPAPKKP